MRLAVTLGFDATFVIKSLASLGPPEELYLLYAITGKEDSRSEAVARDLATAVHKGIPVAIDLRDLATAVRQIADVNFDVVALAGGPRALVTLTYVVAMAKKSRIYLVPEYSNKAIDITSLVNMCKLQTLSDIGLETLINIDGEVRYDELAEKVGLHPTTALKHLQKLEEKGLATRVGDRREAKFKTDKLLTELAKIFLNSRKMKT